MEHRVELAAKALAIERLATGGLAAIAPGRAIGAITTPGSDTEAARYVARLLGIRQIALGVMLWQARDDSTWLRRVVTLNALGDTPLERTRVPPVKPADPERDLTRNLGSMLS
ncbi:MAG TPA: hypothetical protein VE525_18400 [Rubrobacter sp.]|jgi:hypothetical protein|nr:hypothetical protein [Rubrobacter sp.]